MKTFTDEQKEEIRIRVQNALCDLVELPNIIDNLKDFGLTTLEAEWAKDNLDWKVIQL